MSVVRVHVGEQKLAWSPKAGGHNRSSQELTSIRRAANSKNGEGDHTNGHTHSEVSSRLSSLLSATGGAIHAASFKKALAAIDASDLPHFYGSSSKGLWLADSATLFILAAIFGLIAARPSTATRPVVILVALIPAATAILLYTFLGNFFAGHLLLAIAVLAFFGGVQFPRSAVVSTFQ